jgi:hypothetical protein
MRVNVEIDSRLPLKNPPREVDLPDGENTLKDVLQRLSTLYPYLRFVERGEMGDDLRHLYLNGESHFAFPEGLKRKVAEGDTVLVEAYMEPLAGG